MEPAVRVYKRTSQGELAMHLFGATGQGGPTRPAMVFFFGGGWQGGTVEQFYPHARHYAEMGVLVACADYRVASRHETTPFECVRDGKSAVRWLRVHAGELRIDAARVVAGGGSAGGHVAACTGLIAGFDEPDEDGDVSSKPSAMMLFNPVLDLSPRGFGNQRVGENWRDISPLQNVGPRQPPTIVFHGTADTTVPFDQATRFQAAMDRYDNICQVVAFGGKGHGFFNLRPDDDRAYRATLTAADHFLREIAVLD